MPRYEPRSDAAPRPSAGHHRGEHALDALGVEVRERRLIQKSRLNRAAAGEMVDDQVEEFQLVGGERPSFQE
jgi:hypothetical protein